MSFLSLLLSHLLAAYAAFVEPVLGVRLYGDLERKASRDPQAHVRFYRLGLATEWSWVFAVGLIVFFGGPSLSKLGLRFEVPPAEILGFVAAVVFGGLVPVVALWLRRLRSGEPPALAWDGVFHVRTQIAWHGERWRSPALRAFLDPPVRSSARRPAGFLRPGLPLLASGSGCRYMRGLVKILIVLFIVTGLFSYLALPGMIEDQLAGILQERYSLQTEPQVEVSSSFPPELLLGRVDRVQVEIDRINRRGVTLRNVQADLKDIDVSVPSLFQGNPEIEAQSCSLRSERVPEELLNRYLECRNIWA